jgi:hypothetical protein
MFHNRFEELSYDDAMQLLRILAYNGSTNRRAMRQLARQAERAATTDQERRHAQRWLGALRRGHRIKVGTYEAKIYLEGNTPELEADVESAFTAQGDDES